MLLIYKLDTNLKEYFFIEKNYTFLIIKLNNNLYLYTNKTNYFFNNNKIALRNIKNTFIYWNKMRKSRKSNKISPDYSNKTI